MIVPMKKAHLVVLKEDKETLLKSLQKYGVMMLIKTTDSDEAHGDDIDGQYLQRIEKTLRDMRPYVEKEENAVSELVVNYDEFMSDDPQRQEILNQIEKANEEINRLQGENTALAEAIKMLRPWYGLDIRLSEFNSLKYAFLHAGMVETRNVQNLVSLVKDYGGETELLGRTIDGQALVFANYFKDNDEIMEKIKNYGFIEQSLPQEDKTVAELVTEKQNRIDDNEHRVDDLRGQLATFSAKIDQLQLLSDQINSQNELKRAFAQDTVNAVYLEGWVRRDQAEQLVSAIREATDVYDLELTDPAPDESSPTVTENNGFTTPFEAITDMFSKPNPHEIDPNPVMSIWYWLLFGIMMGDAGYGLVMAVFSFLFIKLKKPKGGTLKIMRIFLLSSITTVFWGILFGSYFGFTWDPLAALGKLVGHPGWKSIVILPMENPLGMLILSIAIGFFHILTGICMKAYRNLLDHHYFDAFADQFSWFLILVGLGLLVLPVNKTMVVGMIVAGVVIVVLTAGRHKASLFGKAVSGILNLYSVTGYMSDILSYSRILALALSSAVIAMVMNMLAGMVVGSIPVLGFVLAAVIFAFGHIFNLGMGLLSAYVHDSRLQYIEFFGKFYDGGGYEFKPLSLKLKYVDKVNEKN